MQRKSRKVLTVFTAITFFLLVVLAGTFAGQTPAFGEMSDGIYHVYSESEYLNFIKGAPSYQKVTLHTDIYLDRLDEPIATQSFNGIFEGNGHAIVGLTENASAVNGQPVAWISFLGMDAEIRNLNFIDANIVAGNNTAGQGAVVAGTNYGKLSNVRVHGTVNAVEGGGLVHTNYGAIENCDSFVTSNGNFGSVAYINDELHATEEGVNYDFVGEIKNCYGLGSLVYDNNDYASAEYANGRLAEEKTVKHWFDLYALTHGAVAGSGFTQAGDLNYFNTEAGAIPEDVGYDNAGYVWYHVSKFTGAADTMYIGNTPETVSLHAVTGYETVVLQGEGRKNNPYLIGTATEFAAYLTGNYDPLEREDKAAAKPTYFQLTADIVGDFSGLSERKARQNTVLDGENHSILTKGTLFTEVEATSTYTEKVEIDTDYYGNPIYEDRTVVEYAAEINRLIVRATEGENGVLAETFGGKGESLSIYGVGGSAGVAETVTGTLRNFHTEASGDFAVAKTMESTASVWYGRSMTANAVAESSFGTVQYLYAEGALPQNAQNSVGRTEEGYTVDFATILEKGSEKSGWEFGKPWKFAALRGQEENVVTVPFPEDRGSYKTLNTHTFGRFTSEVAFRISKLDKQNLTVNFRASETGTLLGTHRGVSVYKENGNYYLKGAVGDVTLSSANAILRDICGNTATVVWRERLSAGRERETTDLNRQLGTTTFVARVQTVTGLAYAEFTVKDVDTTPYLSVFLQNYSLNTPNLTEIANNFVGNRDGLQVEWRNQGAVYAGQYAVGLGEYTLTVSCPTDESVVGWTEVRTLNFAQGTNPMDNKDVFGSFTSPITVPYDGTEFDLSEIMPDCAFVGRLSYSITTPGAVVVRNAGTYRVEITLEESRFFPASPKTVTLNVTRKPLTVTPVVRNVVYGEALQVSYVWEDGALATGDTLSESEMRAKLAYTTDYTVGSKVGKYGIKIQDGNFGNYSVTGGSATFTVSPAPLPAPELNLVDEEVDYDGQYHAPELVGKPAGAALSYTVYKGTESVDYSQSGYIDAGRYDYTVTVSLGENYLPAVLTATLTVKKITFRIEAVHADVPYGQPADAWRITVPAIPTRADGKPDDIGTASVEYSDTVYTVGKDVDDYPAMPKGYRGNENFGFEYISATLHVVQADFEIALENEVKGYDGTPYAPIWSQRITEGQITYLNADHAQINAPTQPGDYFVTLRLSESKNYKAFYREYPFTIGKGTIGETSWIWTGSIAGNEFVYDGKTRVLSLQGVPQGVSVSYSWKENGTVKLSNVGISVKNVAEVTEITANLRGAYYQDAQRYYARVTVTPAPISVLTPAKATFNGRAQTPQINLTADSKTYDNVTVSALNTEMVHVGVYLLELSVNNPNYEIKNATPVNFEILCREDVVLTLEEPIVATFGNAFDRFVRETTVVLDGVPYTLNVVYSVGENAQGWPITSIGTYDIFSVPRAQKEQDAKDVTFVLENGKGKYVVEPATVSFDWDKVLKKEYVYTGETYFQAGQVVTIDEREVQGKPVNNFANITVTFEKEVKDAGEYVAVADVGYENFRLSTAQKQFTVEKRVGTILAKSTAISYLSEVPDLQQQVILTNTVAGEKLNYTVSTTYRKGMDVGTYPLEVTLGENPNYALGKEDGVLTVAKIIMGEIEFPEEMTLDYTGLPPALPPFTGAPAGTEFSYRGDYTHAGVYENVTIVAVHKNYWDKLLTLPKLTVRKGKPTLTGTETTVRYRDGLVLSSDQFQVSASYRGQSVPGRVEIAGEGEEMVPGVNRFEGEFIPESGDFEGKTFTLTVTAEIPKEEIQPVIPGIQDGKVTVTEELVIRWALPDGVSKEVFAYLNGTLIGTAEEAVIRESVENALLELKCKGSVVYSTHITVVIGEEPPPEEPTPPEPTPSEEPPEVVDPPKKSNLGLIIGLSVGGGVLVIGLVAGAVTVVLIKKKKDREDRGA